MTELPPRTPLERAVARMMAMEQVDEDLARELVERTFLGQTTLFQEHVRELGRLIIADRGSLLRFVVVVWVIIAAAAIVGFWAGWWTWTVEVWSP